MSGHRCQACMTSDQVCRRHEVRHLRRAINVYISSGFACVVGGDGCVYVAGGSPDGTSGHKSSERFDSRVGKWEMLPDMNKPRGYTACCLGIHLQLSELCLCQLTQSVLGNQQCLYVSGGIHNDMVQGSVECFDIRANAWRLFEPNASNNSTSKRTYQESVVYRL